MPKLIKLKSSLDLTHDESRDRLALERKVEQAFYIAGLSLAQLRDRRLYRSTHGSFEEYCQESIVKTDLAILVAEATI